MITSFKALMVSKWKWHFTSVILEVTTLYPRSRWIFLKQSNFLDNFYIHFAHKVFCAQSVSTKTILISGCVGGAVGVSHISKLGTFFLRSLTLRMPFYSNFQINGASGETVFQNVQLFTTIKVVKSCIFWKTVCP